MLNRRGLAVVVLAAALLIWRVPQAEPAHLGSSSYPQALLAGLDLLLLGLCGWTVLVLGVCALGGRAGHAAARVLPTALRGLLLAGVLTTAATTGAHAETSSPPIPSLDGLTLPDRPVAEARPLPASAQAPSAPSAVTVRSGDCLWRLVARELGPEASPADIAERTRLWHRTNQDVIGPDPDRLLPGQRLTVPPPPS